MIDERDLSDDQTCCDNRSPSVVGEEHLPDINASSDPKGEAGLADALLLIHADALDDLERVRIATENRVRSLEQMKGLEGSPEAARLTGMVDGINALEHEAELQLKRALRKHPLGAWVKRTKGVGEKQGGRLLAAIGDPYWHAQQDRPRTVGELWAYTGYHVVSPTGHGRIANTHSHSAGGDPSPASANLHAGTQPTSADAGPGDSDQIGTVTQSASVGVAPFRKRGVKANWNSAAKMRAFLVAESCIKKMDSPYRPIYDAGRVKYADAVHQVECKRCGPAGKPALPGSELSAGHKHARAMRLVAKAILKDLWLESKALHEERNGGSPVLELD